MEALVLHEGGTRRARALSPLATATALAGTAALAVALATLLVGPAVAWTRDAAALLLLLALASHLVARHPLVLPWRTQHVALAPHEALVLLALLALPPPAAVLFAAPALALRHARDGWRGAASAVGVAALAAAAATLAHGALVDRGAPPLAAALAALVPYALVAHVLAGAAAALREEPRHAALVAERLAASALLHLALGAAGGVIVLALWSYHPAAVAALVPLAWLAREHQRLRARLTMEADAHKRLGETSRALAGERVAERVAERALAACASLLRAGRATLVAVEQGRERRWTRDFGAGPPPDARPIAAPLPAGDGRVEGALLVHPSRDAPARYDDDDRALLAAVAADTAAALAHAGALRQLDAARGRLDAVLAAATDAILLVGADGVVSYANRAARRLFALHGRVEGLPVLGLFDDASFLAEAARAETDEVRRETTARARDGRVPVEVSAAPLREDGRVAGVLVVARDATERKRAEEEVASSRVARPLVRRIVRGLADETAAGSAVLQRMGRSLAREADAEGVEAACRAYDRMGLGRLRLARAEAGRYEFEGEELFEQTPGARATTCHLALGFLCGAVSRLHADAGTLGAETRCASRGDPACRFVVSVREG